MRGSELVLDYVHLLCNQFHKTNSNRRGSYMGSHEWIKNEKATINLINKKDNKWFQYAMTIALNH